MGSSSTRFLLFLFQVLFVLMSAPPWMSTKGARGDQLGYGYTMNSVMTSPEDRTFVAKLGLIKSTQKYGQDIQNLDLIVSYETPDRLRVKITDSAKPRWEITSDIIPRPTSHNTRFRTTNYLSYGPPPPPTGSFCIPDSDLEFHYISTPFNFAIRRRSTNETLFSTSADTGNDPDGPFTGLVFKDQFLTISSSLPAGSSSIYGLGEHTLRSFRLGGSDSLLLTMWNADISSSAVNLNLYGTHPFYMDLRSPSGRAHGVLLLNSNGMDIIYHPSQITYKIDGGIFDFYFFAGDTPEKVVNQYTELVGRPAPMPFWSFGFHQCRYGYKDVADLQGVVNGYAEAGIPLEVMWTDIDYMNAFKDFTLDPVNYPADKMKTFVDNLHKNGQKYVMIVDPGIKVEPSYPAYDRGIEADIFIKRNGQPYLAQVWPGPVHFPDFLNPNTVDYWTNEIFDFYQLIPFDGLWIDMNEVSNFCSGTTCTLPAGHNQPCPRPGAQTQCCLSCSYSNLTIYDDPPFKINAGGGRRPLGDRTLAASAVHYGDVLEYNAHGLYGLMEARATNLALAKVMQKRPFVLSRSTFVGSGTYTAHWTGDNSASWDDLVYSVSGMLNFGIFGVPMVGADICGFNGNTNEELCNRWIQVGAFYPFSRDHSSMGTSRQELYVWQSVTQSAKKALGLRYRLLPYYYTLMYEAHINGTPIARPLFFSFPNDVNTHGIGTQFMIGKGVMVSPVLSSGATSVNAYFPAGTWHDMFDVVNGATVVSGGQTVTLDAPMDKVNVHVRSGSIIPMQEPGKTTEIVRNSPFTLVVALSGGERSKGQLFLDDGEAVEIGKGDGWTYVEFDAGTAGNLVTVSSEVTNGYYAQCNSNWYIQAANIIGLKAGSKFSSASLVVDGGAKDVSKVKVVIVGGRDGNSVAQVSGLSIMVGHQFELTLHMV